jgi:hypothetical protein
MATTMEMDLLQKKRIDAQKIDGKRLRPPLDGVNF